MKWISNIHRKYINPDSYYMYEFYLVKNRDWILRCLKIWNIMYYYVLNKFVAVSYAIYDKYKQNTCTFCFTELTVFNTSGNN